MEQEMAEIFYILGFSSLEGTTCLTLSGLGI